MDLWDVLRTLVANSTLGGSDKDRLYRAIAMLQTGQRPAPPPAQDQPGYWTGTA